MKQPVDDKSFINKQVKIEILVEYLEMEKTTKKQVDKTTVQLTP